MDITLVYKWANNPEDAIVRDDATVRWRRKKLAASDDDAAAIVAARKMSQQVGSPFTAVTIGDGDVSWAAARGAERLVAVESYNADVDETLVAEELARAISSAGSFDLVLMGDAQDQAFVAGLVATRLGVSYVGAASAIEPCTDDSASVIVRRTTENGTETIKLSLPALVSIAAADAELEIPTMKQMLAARKVPVEKIDSSSLGELPSSSVEIVGAHLPEKRRAKLFEGELDTAVRNLVAALRADGVL